MEVNEKQKTILVDKIIGKYGDDLRGKHFALWGLAFKPNTDDIREAPALYIIEKLLNLGATISAFDPEAMPNVKRYHGYPIEYGNNPMEVLKNADALVIVTEWNEFRTPNFDEIKQALKQPVIFDGRNLFPIQEMEGKGFFYNSIGRKTILK